MFHTLLSLVLWGIKTRLKNAFIFVCSVLISLALASTFYRPSLVYFRLNQLGTVSNFNNAPLSYTSKPFEFIWLLIFIVSEKKKKKQDVWILQTVALYNRKNFKYRIKKYFFEFKQKNNLYKTFCTLWHFKILCFTSKGVGRCKLQSTARLINNTLLLWQQSRAFYSKENTVRYSICFWKLRKLVIKVQNIPTFKIA